MNTPLDKKSLTTADLAAAAEVPIAQREVNRDLKEPVIENQNSDVRSEDKQLAPLFLPDVAKDFRLRWDAVQISFVDDPKQAVRQGDELVAEVMKRLADRRLNQRAARRRKLQDKRDRDLSGVVSLSV